MAKKPRQRAPPSVRGDSKKRKPNPFDLKYNRIKQEVLGQRRAQVAGAPGLSRKKALEKRQRTLGVEYRLDGKANKLVDRRLGERDAALSREEKQFARFAAQRTHSAKKKNIDDDETEVQLTHGGASLTAVQKYDRTIRDSDDEENGELGADLVAMAHFGGGGGGGGGGDGVVEKSNPKNDTKSRKQLLSDIIAQAKKARFDQQTAKDEQEEQTDRLDERFRSLMAARAYAPIVRPPKDRDQKREEKLSKDDDYDRLLFNVQFAEQQQRATPKDTVQKAELANSTKTSDLAKLTAQNTLANTAAHLSADWEPALDSLPRKKQRAEKFELRFGQDGAMLNQDKMERPSISRKNDDDDDDDDDESDSEVDDEDDEDEEVGESDDDEDEEADDEENEDEGHEESTASPGLPTTLEELNALLVGKNDVEVLNALADEFHPSRGDGNNKARLGRFFAVVLRHHERLAEAKTADFERVAALHAPLYKLLRLNVNAATRWIRAALKARWKKLSQGQRSIDFSTFSFIRLCLDLYPDNVASHAVTTPLLVHMTRLLCAASIDSGKHFLRAILLAHSILDYVKESKRYVPELAAWVLAALKSASSENPPKEAEVSGFDHPKGKIFVAAKEKVVESEAALPVTFAEIWSNEAKKNEGTTATYRLRILRALISLVGRLRSTYATHEPDSAVFPFALVFEPIAHALAAISTGVLPPKTKGELAQIQRELTDSIDQRRPVRQLERQRDAKPMLRMLEPDIETDFNPERVRLEKRRAPDAAAKKMRHLVAREKRGALRELRKDAAFIARKRGEDQRKKDVDRKRKTDALMASLRGQQAEANRERFLKDKKGKKRR